MKGGFSHLDVEYYAYPRFAERPLPLELEVRQWRGENQVGGAVLEIPALSCQGRSGPGILLGGYNSWPQE